MIRSVALCALVALACGCDSSTAPQPIQRIAAGVYSGTMKTVRRDSTASQVVFCEQTKAISGDVRIVFSESDGGVIRGTAEVNLESRNTASTGTTASCVIDETVHRTNYGAELSGTSTSVAFQSLHAVLPLTGGAIYSTVSFQGTNRGDRIEGTLIFTESGDVPSPTRRTYSGTGIVSLTLDEQGDG